MQKWLVTFSLFLASFVFTFLFQNATTGFEVYEIAYSDGSGTSIRTLLGSSNSQSSVIVPDNGTQYYIDSDIDVGELIIEGQLFCDSRGKEDLFVKTKRLIVNGVFQCGTKNNPYTKKITFSFKDDTNFPQIYNGQSLNTDALLTYANNFNYRALIVSRNGRMVLTGNNRNSDLKAKLAQTVSAESNTNQIRITQNVKNKWLPGDQIVLTSSSFNSYETELFTINAVDTNGAGSLITLNRKVAYLHWGELQSFDNGRGKRFSLDERSEVVNITRNIRFKADETLSSELGIHIMVHPGGAAFVDSVEILGAGQAGVMARYPFHWHRVGGPSTVGYVPGQFIKNSSIHHSFQRCITIHKTSNVVVDNNVCFEFKGHGFFLEDGVEVGNTISNNIGINARHPTPGRTLLASDNNNALYRNDGSGSQVKHSGVTGARFPAVSVFWISNPDNYVRHNVASGSVGTGFWMAYVPQVYSFTNNKFEGSVLATPLTLDTLQFSHNTAHTTLVGITWDGAPDHSINGNTNSNMENKLNPADRVLLSAHYNPTNVPVFSHLLVYKNMQSGIYYRGQTAIFDNTILADNRWNYFLAYNQIIKRSAIIARSNNSTLNERVRFLAQQREVGITIYDGPFEMDDVHFFNFSTDLENRTLASGEVAETTNSAFYSIGGAARYTNITRGISFTPDPHYRIFQGSEVWIDADSTTRIRDLDGSLTGVANSLVVPNNTFSTNSSCQEKIIAGKNRFPDFKVCTNSNRGVTLLLGGPQAMGVPFIVRKNDGSLSHNKDQWSRLDETIVQYDNQGRPLTNTSTYINKVYLENNNNESYELLFLPKHRSSVNLSNVSVRIFSEYADQISPVIRFSGYGAECSITGGSRVSSLAQLENATQDSYFAAGNQFYVRLKTVSPLSLRNPAYAQGLTRYSTSQIRYIRCNQPLVKNLVGIMNATIPALNPTVGGWACLYNSETPVDIHVYADGPYGKGKLILTGKADVSSEAAVNFACASGATGHRFSIPIPLNLINTHGNLLLYTYAVADGKSHLLTNSGTAKIPSSMIKGYSNALQIINNTLSLSGWACESGINQSIDVHIYVEDLKVSSGQRLIGSATANRTSEDAVRAACNVSNGNYRFLVPISTSLQTQIRGKKVFVYGISKTGKANMLLNKSGSVLLP